MRREIRTAWLALLLAVACTAALWVLPARWVMAWIPESSPVMVTDAAGTMWAATATVAVGAGSLRRTLPDPVQWRLAFKGGPHLVLIHPWLRGPLTLSPSWRGLRLSAQTLQLPVSVLTTAHAMFNTMDPGGEMLLDWPDLILGKGAVASNDNARLLTAQWRNASSSLTRIQPMGAYTLVLQQDAAQNLTFALSTNQGPLLMEGEGTVSKSGRAQFDGKAWIDESASGDVHAALQDLLDAIGPRSVPSGHAIMKVR